MGTDNNKHRFNFRFVDRGTTWLADACKLMLILGIFQLGADLIESKKVAVNDPLVYTRLRFDRNYYPAFHKYQLEKPYEEEEKRVKINETLNEGVIREVEYTYYENKQIEASSVKYEDLVLEALDRTYQHRLYQGNIYNYDSEDDKRKASDPKLVSTERCHRELDYLLSKLSVIEQARKNRTLNKTPVEPEVAAFFDSFASEEPGLLFGNYHWTGNWHQCSRRLVFDLDRTNPSNTIAFKGRYCIASIRNPKWESSIREKTKIMERTYFKYPAQKSDYNRFFRIQVGICLPQSCDSLIVDSRRGDIKKLALHKLHKRFDSYALADLFCLPDETSELRKLEPSAWMFIYSALAWSSIIILATIYDIKYPRTSINKTATKKGNLDKLISALSLVQNFKRLTETESITYVPTTVSSKGASGSKSSDIMVAKPQPQDLLFFNAFKVISVPLLMHVHVVMIARHIDRFPLDYEIYNSDFLFHAHTSSVLNVDWYFTMTGFITTYIMFLSRRVEQNSIVQWIYAIFQRYWRLAPIYLVLVWFSKSVFQHTGSGPIWDYGTSNMTLRSICRQESWWWPLTLTCNWHPLHDQCTMPAWYICNDMQFYLITPIILVTLAKSPKKGWLLTLGLIAASCTLTIHRYMTDPRAKLLELLRPRFDLYTRWSWDMHPTYLYPQYRIAPYLIGILAGHYSYMVLSGRWSSILVGPNQLASQKVAAKVTERPLTRLLRTITWFLGLKIVLATSVISWILLDWFPSSWDRYANYTTPILLGTSHATVGLGIALLFVAFMFGQYPRLRRVLSHPIWTIIIRLNFFVYIGNVEVLYWLQQTSDRVVDFGNLVGLRLMLSCLMVCYMISLFVVLFLEYPLAHLEREFISGFFVTPRKPSIDKQPVLQTGERSKSD